MDRLLSHVLNSRLSRPRVLVVDDQAMNIHLVREVLKGDCDIFMASNGQQAIAQCQALMPDLVLLDLLMPGMDGHETCRQLKGNPLTRAIPVIFISAQRDEEDEALGFELGAADYILKPFNRTILHARVRLHLAMKQQTDMLKAMVHVDGLTGLANRRKLDEDLLLGWKQCCREQQPYSLILLDVDFFKRYNDRYGHLMGDECLRQVAQALKQGLRRPADLLARYGGEEFCALLPGCGSHGAKDVAGKLLALVRDAGIAHADSPVDSVVTISLGVVTVEAPAPAVDPLLLLSAADQLLYQAKHGGRACFRATVLVP